MTRIRLRILLATSFAFVALCLSTAIAAGDGAAPASAQTAESVASAKSQYIVIAWNDLGMHCISPSFDQMAILPPYNNLFAQVIKRGNPPSIVTSNVTVEYSIKKNTTTVGKTNFWQNAQALFGVNLPQGIGLTGNGLAGSMSLNGTHFEARGIPTVPYDDPIQFYPYKKGAVNVRTPSGTVIATTTATIPVSNELHCDKCHSSGGPGAIGIDTGTVDGNILTVHDLRSATDLMAARPVLCASCHADNALGTPGTPGVEPLSLAMHGKHATLGANQPGCYDCHPGQQTQCLRTAIEGMGPVGTDPKCERCHGSLENVAQTIRDGRQPWLDEPTCAQCHGTSFSTGTALYRNSTDHGGAYCAACHNSPHAWWPSHLKLDNKQPNALQGRPEFLGDEGKCKACHTTNPGGGGPHGGGGGDILR
ncbi:MAG TPA: cytochrome c3 family protein [Blastocatellia bacterium]|nr:cytochrome c3 family protein [Blastocatellia bacterium]